MLEKARSGIYPSYAPVGYRNVDGPNGKRVIVPDEEAGPIIRSEIYERFATGKYSLEALTCTLRKEGVTLRGRKIYKALLHQILFVHGGFRLGWRNLPGNSPSAGYHRMLGTGSGDSGCT